MNTFFKTKYSVRALVLSENFCFENITTKNLLASIKFLVRCKIYPVSLQYRSTNEIVCYL